MEIEQKPLLEAERTESIRRRLRLLYGAAGDVTAERLFAMLQEWSGGSTREDAAPQQWDESDVVLISYSDSIQARGEYPLEALRQFAAERLKGAVSTIHLLPFYPWSSDDGFSVIDYREVAGEYGSWNHIDELGLEFRLMFDLVLNHCSKESRWFKDFLEEVEPGCHYFVPVNPDADLSDVVRPRPWPLLTRFQTRTGEKWVWTTFSEDQVDLNWQNPEVFLEFIEIVLLYLSHGSCILRLDAVAFLWKEPGTNCLHRPQTHEVIKLMREVLETVSPEVLLLTETNVPHPENISYFGNGDEAQMVYNFTLPPLLLYSLLRHDSSHLTSWARHLPALAPGNAFLNFTASHDGIGVRPLQGTLEEDDVAWLVEEIRGKGGLVSMKGNGDGSESPYELNITYVSALTVPGDQGLSKARFLCSQAVALALQGMPAVYMNSLLGIRNWDEGVAASGENRAINRRRHDIKKLNALLDDAEQLESGIFETYLRWLQLRRRHPVFHPEAAQRILDLSSSVFGVERRSCDGGETMICLFNFTPAELRLEWGDVHPELAAAKTVQEVLSETSLAAGAFQPLILEAYQPVWLVLP